MNQSDQQALFDPMAADIGDLLENIDDVADDPRIWPKSLAELVDVLADDHKEQGMDEDDAFAAARRSIALISHYWGGRMTYLPRNDKLRTALRDNQIYRAFNGNNITALAIKHGLTDMQIYNIIKHQRKLTLKRKQREMFSE
jgi:Mor family transcriptional regulator